MIDLGTLFEEYLATRRALGVRLPDAERRLGPFVAFLGQHEAPFITTELAHRWATEPDHAQPAQWARRLGLVRGFACYAHAVDPRHEIPPQGLISYRYRRPQPYIYSEPEIADLIAAAQELPGTTGLRPFTYATLLALLSVTGMRTGEILSLDRDDVDLANGVLTVRDGKFGKSRHIPLHESTGVALGRYAARRDRLCPAARDPAFFLNESGTRIKDWTIRWTFVRLSRRTGLREPAKSSGYGPRLLDMRHSFAVGTLVRWYREGVDVERHIPRLATWLGHAHVSDTYWYLSATPELMQAAAKRLDRIAPRPRP
ncbi:MAG: tyrosine-type recombinase/integrase [Gammaproteobacteria bacterium]|nr:tyrosine-type recombinase/integrase [Gammaproteobacteria bacterium]